MSAAPCLVAAAGDAAPYFWLQPTVTTIGPVLVLVGAGVTVRQRHHADRRDQWWRRTQWALELLLSGDEESIVLGRKVLTQQVKATVADQEDASLIADVLTPWVDSYEER